MVKRLRRHLITALVLAAGAAGLLACGGGGGGGDDDGGTPTPGTLQFSSAAYSVAENGGNVTITVTRTGGSDGAASVGYATQNGTATAGSDYTTATGVLNWVDGDATAKTFTVGITDDADDEADETVTLTLSGATGATLGATASATLTIVDDEGVVPIAGTLQFGSAAYSVAEGGGNVTITVTRVGGSDGAASVGYATQDGTATAGSDYTTATGVLNWVDGDATAKTFTVGITDDADDEADETVTLTLSGATGATLGATASATLTIVDDDGVAPSAGTLQFSSAAYSVAEGGGNVTITVTRTGGSDGAASVGYATQNGTATAGSDYTTATGVLNWVDGDATAKTFTVGIADDADDEADETVTLTLSGATGATLGATASATLTITDDDDVAPAATAKSVSGRVDVEAAAAAKVVTVQDAVVTVTSFNATGAQIDSATASSGTTGFFTALVEQANSGGYLLVDVLKDGFTDARKRVDFAAPQNVTVNATLRSLTTVVVSVEGGAVLSRATGETVPGFTFAVVRSASGARRVVAGRAALQAAKAADAVTELEINIPAASTGLDGVDTLVGRLESFDPNDAGDAQAFPGDYLDSDGNRLLSVAFDYVAISDENGENLGSLAQTAARAAGKAAVAETRISRYIPTGSCGSLVLGDADDATDGFQVPVYTYIPPQGVWGLLGTGTVVDGSGVNVGDVTPADCETNGYNLDILVSNEEFIRSWWNLDYPLVFSEPVQVCIEKTFVTDAGDPVESLYVSLDDDDNADSFAYAYGYTNAEGKATISALLLDGADTDRAATLTYWNPYSYSYVSEPVNLGDAPNCTTRTNTLMAPDFCTVRGTVVDAAGVGQANEYLWIYGTGASTYYTYAYTDAAGAFEAAVHCDEDMELYLGGDDTAGAVFNVSGATTDHPDYEASDDGAVVELADVIAENQPPQAWAYLSAYNIRTTGTAMVYLYAWDYEGDYPITYIVKANGVTKATGTISASDASYAEIPLGALTEGTYAVSVDVTDNLDATTSVIAGTLYVTAAGANRLPMVYAYAAPTRVSAAGEVLTFWAYGWDLDGDAITYSWTVNGAAAGAGDAVEYTVPAGATEGDSYAVEVTAFDGLGSSTASFTLYFGTPTQVDVIVQ